MRGILGGGFWGLVVGGAAVASASLVGPPPERGVDTGLENALVAADGGLSDGASPSPVSNTDAPDVEAPDTEDAAPPSLTAEAPVTSESTPSGVAIPEAEEAPAAIETDVAAPPTVEAEVDTTAPTISSTTDQADAADTSEGSTAPGAEITADVDELATPEVGTAPVAVTEETAAPQTNSAPEIIISGGAGSDTAPATDTSTADQPVVAATGTLTPPPEAPESGSLESTEDAPVVSDGVTASPAAPEQDTLDLASADVADPPGIAPEITATAPEAGVAPAVDGGSSPNLDGTVEVVQPLPDAPETPAAPEVEDDIPAADTTPSVPETDTATGPIGEDTTVVVVEPPAEEVEVVIVEDDTTPTVSVLPSGSGGVKVNRFGVDDDNSDAAASETAAPEPESFPEGTPAYVRYGVPGENLNDLPELSVILVDDGELPNAVAAVKDIRFPVSVMLNPAAPDAAARMTAYRAAGIEVGILATLPPSATPSDVAIFFEAALANLPETVAVLDADGETQVDTEVIRETVAALAEDGRGLITVPRGLNSAQRVASESGVPAGVIFRDLDGDGQDNRVIQRFMDQAAFRARQESGVILLGRVRDETVSALTQWATGSRATQVAMQPVSAVLSTD
ncbi:MAG: divergent polysaccharide deacetylase family protein [Pseudomonadota bacterium]